MLDNMGHIVDIASPHAYGIAAISLSFAAAMGLGAIAEGCIELVRVDFKWEDPDVKGHVNYMCEEKGFDEQRIRNKAKDLNKACIWRYYARSFGPIL